jgi:hypothetical protein
MSTAKWLTEMVMELGLSWMQFGLCAFLGLGLDEVEACMTILLMTMTEQTICLLDFEAMWKSLMMWTNEQSMAEVQAVE